MFIKIEDPLLENRFETLKNEIIHLTKLGGLKINQKLLAENSNSLNFKISKECSVSMVFEVSLFLKANDLALIKGFNKLVKV